MLVLILASGIAAFAGSPVEFLNETYNYQESELTEGMPPAKESVTYSGGHVLSVVDDEAPGADGVKGKVLKTVADGATSAQRRSEIRVASNQMNSEEQFVIEYEGKLGNSAQTTGATSTTIYINYGNSDAADDFALATISYNASWPGLNVRVRKPSSPPAYYACCDTNPDTIYADPIPRGQWYKVKFVLWCQTALCDVYIDDVAIMTSVKVDNNTALFQNGIAYATISVSTASGAANEDSTAYFNNIKISGTPIIPTMSFQLMDGNQNPTIENLTTGNIQSTAVFSGISKNIPAVIILALYRKDGEQYILEDISYQEDTLSSLNTSISTQLNVTNTQNRFVRIYLWDSLEGMKPLLNKEDLNP